jgi:hypothetical protein
MGNIKSCINTKRTTERHVFYPNDLQEIVESLPEDKCNIELISDWLRDNFEDTEYRENTIKVLQQKNIQIKKVDYEYNSFSMELKFIIDIRNKITKVRTEIDIIIRSNYII